MTRLLQIALLLATLAMPLRLAAEEVTVFAAASLANALDAVVDGFEAETGHAVTLSYAGSSALARQIGQGAPADVFLSANTAWMDWLEAEGLLVPGSRRDLLRNRLVLVGGDLAAPKVDIAPGLDLAGMLGSGRLAMALVDAVPAGIYGRQALGALGLWDSVAPQVAQADNVRAALALVAVGAAPLGIVYATDAVPESRVAVLGIFPETSHDAITYPAARLQGRDNAAADAFLAYLSTEAARAAFEGQGFTVIGD
ncbi:molybdate ABC transporter substrate-binding protein [Mesobacterium pallidum]|uniref:molybdate ABC transporter substrate-binding protein n=1 Tax=Mesobacterium pallidum TaxID=2872037 RepID=UPI001EE2530F|nr:molybdate ABC transporter substrate-binding protein [Mesobacterium pallidum]